MTWVLRNLSAFLLETVLVSVQDWCMICALWYRRLRHRFGRTQWNSKVTWAMPNLILVRLEAVLVSV